MTRINFYIDCLVLTHNELYWEDKDLADFTLHASPFGIPSKKKCPTEFLNFFWLKSGHVLGKHKSEVWGVGAF